MEKSLQEKWKDMQQEARDLARKLVEGYKRPGEALMTASAPMLAESFCRQNAPTSDFELAALSIGLVGLSSSFENTRAALDTNRQLGGG